MIKNVCSNDILLWIKLCDNYAIYYVSFKLKNNAVPLQYLCTKFVFFLYWNFFLNLWSIVIIVLTKYNLAFTSPL